MIDRHLVRYFLAVVDHGNFSAAARHCRVSQPTLSVGVARLEDLLGRRVFNRSNRRVELTPAGARLVVPARRIEADFAEAERAVIDDRPVETVRLGVISTLPDAWIEEAIAAAKNGSNERLEIVEIRPHERAAFLERGRIDAGIGLRQPGYLFGIDLWSEGYAVALAGSHAFAGRKSISAESIAGETMLVRRGCEAIAQVSRHFTSRGIRPFMAARTRSEARAAAYVRAGVGVTVMPFSFAADGISLCALEGFDLQRTVDLATLPSKRHLLMQSPALSKIVAVLRSRATVASNVGAPSDLYSAESVPDYSQELCTRE